MISKTELYISSYQEIEPLINFHFSKKGFTDQTKLMLLTGLLSALNKAYSILNLNRTENNLKIQTSIISAPFQENNNVLEKIILASLNYWEKKMIIDGLNNTDLYDKIIFNIKKYKSLISSDLDNKLPVVEKYNKININERSYVWLGYNVQKQLNTLFVKFKEELNLIEEKTNFIDFARVFMGTELNHIKNKINWKGPLRALIYFIIRACHREHLEIENNLRWKQLAATFYFNGHELKKEEFEKEFFKLSNTEHIPSVGPEIDLIFRSFI